MNTSQVLVCWDGTPLSCEESLCTAKVLWRFQALGLHSLHQGFISCTHLYGSSTWIQEVPGSKVGIDCRLACESRMYKHQCGRLAPCLLFPFLNWSHNQRHHVHGFLVVVLHFCLLSLLSWLLSGRFMVVPVSNMGKEMPAGTVSNTAELGRSWRFGSWTLKAWPVLNRSVQRSTESIRDVSRTSFELWII